METVEIARLADVAAFINHSDGQRRQNATVVLLLALGGIFTDAYDFTSLSIGAVQLKHEFGLTPLALGTLTSSMALGALLGGLFGGYVTDRVGRVRMFAVNMALFVLATLVAALAPNYGVLLVARVFMGIGVGLDFPVAMSFIAEYSSLRRKGSAVNLWQAVWYTAGACCYIVGLAMIGLGAGPSLWRWAVAFGALPAFVVLLLRFVLMHESPLWEAARGNLAAAGRILEATYHVRVHVDPAAQARFSVRSHRESLAVYGQLFSPRYRWRTIQSLLVSTTQNVEYYGVAFYFPTIALILFGRGLAVAIAGSLVFNLFGIAGGVLQSRLTNRVGVRRLAIIGFTGVIATLVVLGLTGRHIPPLAGALLIGLFIFSHAFGPGSQGLTLATLSFPTEMRGVATGFVQACQRVGSIFGFYYFPLLVASITLYPTLLVLALVPAIGLLSALLIRWDPTGMDLDIEDGATANNRASLGERVAS